LYNLSDLLFILFFPAVYLFYRINPAVLCSAKTRILTIVFVVMISVSFFGVDSQEYGRNRYVDYARMAKKHYSASSGNKLQNVEMFRIQHNGFFRLPHIAAYLFGFLFLYWLSRVIKTKNRYLFIPAFLILLIIIYTGVRTWLFACLVSLVLLAIYKKYFKYLIPLAMLLFLIIVFRYQIYLIVEETVLVNYASFVITLVDNFEFLNRTTLFRSWWQEIISFSWYDYLVGKGFIESVIANNRNLRFSEWFHSDLLSVSFCYGFPALALYIGLIVRIFRDFKNEILTNGWMFVFFFTMILCATFNGLYYYFPFVFMYLFLLMLRDEKQKPGFQH